jgi:thiamine biosynthesis lipoprotein
MLFGSEVSMTLVGGADAGSLRPKLEAELSRLEAVFSLSDPASAIARLNREGKLEEAPAELLDVTRRALVLAERTGGAFDPTIQVYWAWLQEQLAAGEVPDEARRRELLESVNFRMLHVGDDTISFQVPGMGMTLNSMAQGFVTDAVVSLLEREGVRNCLVNLGEFAARGRDGRGNPWTVEVRSGGSEGRIVAEVTLDNEALAVSSGGGHRLTATGAWNHLLSSRDGRSPDARRTVVVTAPKAVTADGLATACGLLNEEEGRELVAGYPGAKVRYFS